LNFFTWESVELLAELRNSLNGSKLEEDVGKHFPSNWNLFDPSIDVFIFAVEGRDIQRNG